MKFSNLGSYKVLNTYLFFAYLFAIFEILSGYPEFWFLVVLKCYSKKFQRYEIRISYPLVGVSIRFSPLLDFILKSFIEEDIHFVLLEFVVVLLWETMTFYWIIWRPQNGDPMRITLLNFNEKASEGHEKKQIKRSKWNQNSRYKFYSEPTRISYPTKFFDNFFTFDMSLFHFLGGFFLRRDIIIIKNWVSYLLLNFYLFSLVVKPF